MHPLDNAPAAGGGGGAGIAKWQSPWAASRHAHFTTWPSSTSALPVHGSSGDRAGSGERGWAAWASSMAVTSAVGKPACSSRATTVAASSSSTMPMLYRMCAMGSALILPTSRHRSDSKALNGNVESWIK